jgi:hypothetical protein
VPTGRDNGYGAEVGRPWNTTVPTSRPVISSHIDPLKSTLLEANLRQTPTWSNMSSAGYRQHKFLPCQVLALVTTWKRSKNVNSIHAEVWCVPSATHVSFNRRSQKKKKPSVSEGSSPYFFITRLYIKIQISKAVGLASDWHQLCHWHNSNRLSSVQFLTVH